MPFAPKSLLCKICQAKNIAINGNQFHWICYTYHDTLDMKSALEGALCQQAIQVTSWVAGKEVIAKL